MLCGSNTAWHYLGQRSVEVSLHSPCGSAFLYALPASTKLVAESSLFCSCMWSRAAWQNALPAAKNTHTSYILNYTSGQHLWLLWRHVLIELIWAFQVCVCGNLKAVYFDSWAFDAHTAHAYVSPTTPVLGHFKHVGCSGVHFTGILHLVVPPVAEEKGIKSGSLLMLVPNQ